MSTQTANPLAGFFRQPSIHLTLPSKGSYWDEDALSLPVTGELPVYPMTTKDEITLKTPDALLNGAGVVSVIQSCCPNILDPWKMPSVDVDAVLIAIRIASYGNLMEIETTCPHCNEENMYEVDLNQTMAQIKSPDYSSPLVINGLTIYFQPQKYFSLNKTNQTNFEEQRIMQTISNTEISEDERAKVFTEHLTRLVNLNIQILVDSTKCIVTPDGQQVTDPTFITEFYQNTNRAVVQTARDQLAKVSNDVSIKPITVACNSCAKEFKLNITFDYANFFA